MAINDDLNSLLSNTKNFLENNALLIHGAAGPSANHQFVLQATGQEGWKSAVGGVRDIPRFICYPAASAMALGVGPSSAAFAAVSVSMRSFNPATHSYEDSATTHHILPTDGPEVMVTTMLSGCTFGIGSNAGGARLVSHVQPPEGRTDGPARSLLDHTIRAGFQGGRLLQVSVMSSREQCGTVVGIRTGGTWTFYVQRFSHSAATGVVNSVQVY